MPTARRALRHAVSLLGLPTLLLAGFAHGAEDEQRILKLNDGRVLVGIVAESTSEGMLVDLIQGRTLVRYEQLEEIEVVVGVGESPPLRIAVAPATRSGAADDEGSALDGWLSEVAGLIPEVQIVGPADWAGQDGAAAVACAGDVSCLVKAAAGVGVGYVLVPTLHGSREVATLTITGAVVPGAAVIGQGTSAASGTRHDLAPGLLSSCYAALGITPNLDPAGLAGAAFPEALAEVATGPANEPAGGAAVAETPEPLVEPDAEPPSDGVVSTASRVPPPSGPTTRRLPVAIALGFAPVPGITSAYLGDVPGFLVSLIGSVALGWTAVYTLGATVRWEEPFVASSILVPYALSVAFNQVSGLVGWRRLHGPRARVASLRPLGAAVGPVLTRNPTGGVQATGAAVSWTARF